MKKYLKIKIFLNTILYVLFFCSNFALAIEFDGVYMSTPNKTVRSQVVTNPKVNQNERAQKHVTEKEQIQQYVRNVVIQELLDITADIVERAIRSHNIDLYQQLIYASIQEATMQSFNQTSTKEILMKAFIEASDQALNDLNEKNDTSTIQGKILIKVKEIIAPITKDNIYKQIIEKVLNNAMAQQKKIVVMQLAQRQVQLADVQRRYMVMHEAVKKQYEAYLNAYIEEVLKQSLSVRK